MKEETLYEEILNAAPSRDTVNIILKQMSARGRVNEAIKWCHTFLRVFPDDLDLTIFLAECLISRGLSGQAEMALQKAKQKISATARIYKLLADIYRGQGRLLEAAEAARLYLAYHPEDAGASEILDAFEQAEIDHHPAGDKMAVHSNGPQMEKAVDFATPTIAELYYNQGQLEAAAKTYEKVLTENPEDKGSLERLTQLKAEMKAHFEADEGRKRDRIRKERMIQILETWLPRLEELRYG